MASAVGVLVSPALAFPPILYTSNGFEAPTFSPGNVVGQNGWIAQGAGNSSATVHGLSSGNPVAAGSQALTLFREGDDGAGASYFTRVLPSAFQHPFVTINWDMYVPANTSAVEYGPGFSVEAYATGNRRIAAFGMDAADGSLYQVINNNPSTPNFTLTSDVQLDTWQNWKMIIDLLNELVYLSVDGNVITTGQSLLENISYATGDKLTDAALTVHPTDGNFFGVEGQAFIDNYYITTSPFQFQPGDYNASGMVEQADLDLVLGNWGASAAPVPGGWINDLPSGNIDQNELDAVLANWGVSVAPSFAGFAVPEPATAVAGLVLSFVALRRRTGA